MPNTELLKKEIRQRVIALLTREEIDFLDKLSNDARFSTGKKFTHTKIISTLVDMIMRLNIDGKGLMNPIDLEERIKNALIKNLISAALIKTPVGKKEEAALGKEIDQIEDILNKEEKKPQRGKK